jgi:hypothetical protein
MINLNIIKAKDPDRVGQFRFFKNLISIGCNIKNEVYLPKENFKKNSFRIECIEDKLIITPNDNVDNFHVNGKLTTTYKYLQIGDIIKFQEAEFKILDFQFQNLKSEQKLLNEVIAKADPNDAEFNDIINLLR